MILLTITLLITLLISLFGNKFLFSFLACEFRYLHGSFLLANRESDDCFKIKYFISEEKDEQLFTRPTPPDLFRQHFIINENKIDIDTILTILKYIEKHNVIIKKAKTVDFYVFLSPYIFSTLTQRDMVNFLNVNRTILKKTSKHFFPKHTFYFNILTRKNYHSIEMEEKYDISFEYPSKFISDCREKIGEPDNKS